MNKIQNKIRLLFLSVLMLFAPAMAFAATDIGINANGVWLSVPFNNIEVSKTVRIYARVENASTEDSVADVEFYIDDALLGTRSVSVLAKDTGVAFWDWTTPVNPDQIALTIRVHRQLGGDENPDNDEVTIYDLWVNSDSDADQVYNRVDNCPNIVNTEQKDTDNDGIGDACEEKPASPVKPSTPPSNGNAAPAAPKPATPVAEPKAVPAPVVAAPIVEQPVETLDPVVADQASEESVTTDAEVVTMEAETNSGLETQPDLLSATGDTGEVFLQAEQLSWNAFRFRPSSRLGTGDYTYEWDFGDKTTASERVVEHTFKKPGRYNAVLRIVEPDGSMQTSSVLIRVGFFNLANWRLWIIIALLALIIIVASMMAGVTDAIVGPATAEDAQPRPTPAVKGDEQEIESLSSDTGDLDTLASSGVSSKALGDELSLLEELDSSSTSAGTDGATAIPGLAALASDEGSDLDSKFVEKKKPATKKRPGKKRTVKVKKVL